MSANGEENSSLSSEELVFLLAIAGRIDAQSRLLAQKLDKNRYIYHAYAIADSLSSSYSMFKYFMEVFVRNTDPDYLHQILTSPEGIAAISAEAIFLVSFSFLASVFDGEENNSVKKFIATAWPYFRDVMKGLKNAYKGWRSTMQVLSLIGGVDLKYLIIPVGLGLGIFAAANRFWIRSMVEHRKKQMNINTELLAEIKQLSNLDSLSRDRDHYLSLIEYQSDQDRVYAYLAVGAGGLLDGLYLYVGVVSLSILSPPLLIAMSVIGAIYTLSCVITRIYEEYDFQLRLKVTQTKCLLELTSKELELTYAKLLKLQDNVDKTGEDLEEIQKLRSEVCRLIQQLEKERQLLKSQTNYTYLTAGLLGMKYGLYAYGVLTSILFTIATVCLITAVSFPPALLAVFIVSGLVLMAGMTAYTIKAHYQNLKKQEAESKKEHPYDRLLEMKNNVEKEKNAEILNAEHFNKSLKDGLQVSSSPPTYFQEWFEVLRSFASGLSKGNNFSYFALTFLQESDSDGHYHDIPAMGVLAIMNGVLFSITLGLRALARGLGRPPKGQCAPKGNDPVGASMEKKETEHQRESCEPKPKAYDSLTRRHSYTSWTFFSYPKPKKSNTTLTHSMSDSALNQYPKTTSASTIQGLT